jgi:hypothetical protein
LFTSKPKTAFETAPPQNTDTFFQSNPVYLRWKEAYMRAAREKTIDRPRQNCYPSTGAHGVTYKKTSGQTDDTNAGAEEAFSKSTPQPFQANVDPTVPRPNPYNSYDPAFKVLPKDKPGVNTPNPSNLNPQPRRIGTQYPIPSFTYLSRTNPERWSGNPAIACPNVSPNLTTEIKPIGSKFAMGLSTDRIVGDWTYHIHLSRRFDTTNGLLFPPVFTTTHVESNPLTLRIEIKLKVNQKNPSTWLRTEDVALHIKRAPSDCARIQTYYKQNETGNAVLNIYLFCTGSAYTPPLAPAPAPWSFAFDVDLGQTPSLSAPWTRATYIDWYGSGQKVEHPSTLNDVFKDH